MGSEEEKVKQQIEGILADDATLQTIADNIMGKFDTDKSGTLEKDEVKKLVQFFLAQNTDGSLELCLPDEVYDQIFQIFDKDNSNSLDRGELKDFLKCLLQEMLKDPAQESAPAPAEPAEPASAA